MRTVGQKVGGPDEEVPQHGAQQTWRPELRRALDIDQRRLDDDQDPPEVRQRRAAWRRWAETGDATPSPLGCWWFGSVVELSVGALQASMPEELRGQLVWEAWTLLDRSGVTVLATAPGRWVEKRLGA